MLFARLPGPAVWILLFLRISRLALLRFMKAFQYLLDLRH